MLLVVCTGTKFIVGFWLVVDFGGVLDLIGGSVLYAWVVVVNKVVGVVIGGGLNTGVVIGGGLNTGVVVVENKLLTAPVVFPKVVLRVPTPSRF